jgi:oligopeptidase B
VVRGGGELGRHWAAAARGEHKRRSVDDFLAVADHLTAAGWSRPGRMAARGASAGGLLVLAAAAARPSQFAAVTARVPFAAPLAAMMTDGPLTAHERAEWGDPMRCERVFAALRALDPLSTARQLARCAPHVG